MRINKLAGIGLIALVGLLGISVMDCRANAINVTNVSISSVSGGMADVQFDISWSNSWNLSWSDDGGQTTITNWDAAWVFLKFKTPSSSWRHGMLASSGHTAAAGTSIEIGANGSGTNIGVFIRRATQSAGELVAQGMKLRWDFAQSSLGGTSDVDISVHAIEMVYIPEGSFALGSGGAESTHFYKFPISSDPYIVTNESAITAGTTTGNLNCDGNNYRSSLPASFPKGYAPFYCMKYEISQGQYASFLNHLDSGLASARYPDFFGSNRFSIATVSNQFVVSAPDRACNFLNVADVCSYLDWAGLRPMSELEYEKSCRGTTQPEPNEYAWGSTTITRFLAFNGVDGSGSETALPALANSYYGTNNGPVRVGIFAEQSASRQKSGSGYYGVMDLSGNVSELAVAAYLDGPSYIPTHGDGTLPVLPVGWPGYQGFFRRGGSWGSSAIALSVSIRDTTMTSARDANYGGRGVRTSQQ